VQSIDPEAYASMHASLASMLGGLQGALAEQAAPTHLTPAWTNALVLGVQQLVTTLHAPGAGPCWQLWGGGRGMAAVGFWRVWGGGRSGRLGARELGVWQLVAVLHAPGAGPCWPCRADVGGERSMSSVGRSKQRRRPCRQRWRRQPRALNLALTLILTPTLAPTLCNAHKGCGPCGEHEHQGDARGAGGHAGDRTPHNNSPNPPPRAETAGVSIEAMLAAQEALQAALAQATAGSARMVAGSAAAGEMPAGLSGLVQVGVTAAVAVVRADVPACCLQVRVCVCVGVCVHVCA